MWWWPPIEIKCTIDCMKVIMLLVASRNIGIFFCQPCLWCNSCEWDIYCMLCGSSWNGVLWIILSSILFVQVLVLLLLVEILLSVSVWVVATILLQELSARGLKAEKLLGGCNCLVIIVVVALQLKMRLSAFLHK